MDVPQPVFGLQWSNTPFWKDMKLSFAMVDITWPYKKEKWIKSVKFFKFKCLLRLCLRYIYNFCMILTWNNGWIFFNVRTGQFMTLPKLFEPLITLKMLPVSLFLTNENLIFLQKTTILKNALTFSDERLGFQFLQIWHTTGLY